MGAFNLAWLSFIRRRAALVWVLTPTAILFSLLTLLIALESGAKSFKDPHMDLRILRLGNTKHTPYTLADVEKIKKLPHVVDIARMTYLGCLVNDQPEDWPDPCAATEDVYFHAFGPPGNEGVSAEVFNRWKSEKDGVIVGKDLADARHWTVGSQITFKLEKKTPITVRMSGIATGTSRRQFFLHAEFMDTFRGQDAGRAFPLWVELDDGANLDAVMASIREYEQLNGRIAEMGTLAAMKESALSLSKLYTVLLESVGIVALMVVVFTTLAMMSLSIDRRRRELATLRAIGCRRSFLLRSLLLESALLSGTGALVGVLAAYYYFSTHPLQMSPYFKFEVTGMNALFAAALGFLIGPLTSLVPISRAAAANVLTELRD